MNFEEPAGCQDKDGPRKRCRHDRLRIVAPPLMNKNALRRTCGRQCHRFPAVLQRSGKKQVPDGAGGDWPPASKKQTGPASSRDRKDN